MPSLRSDPNSSLLLFHCFLTLVLSLQTRETDRYFLNLGHGNCRGFFPEPQCQCTERSISCVNSRLRSPEMLSSVEWSTKLQYLTFHGNNFGHLPQRVLTNISALPQLTTLNLSANYLVSFHRMAFVGLPNVEILDLSENEIILNESMRDLFAPLSRLKALYLRRAFRQSTNRLIDSASEKQMACLENMFRVGKLYNLERLDLSMNGFTVLPAALFCPIDRITHIFLSQNNLRTINLNLNCVRHVRVLDLRENRLVALDSAFYHLSNRLPLNSIRLKGNPFQCYCNSSFYISWLISTDKIFDKANLTCEKAWPREYARRRLIAIPVDKLECPSEMEMGSSGGNGARIPKQSLVLFVMVISCKLWNSLISVH